MTDIILALIVIAIIFLPILIFGKKNKNKKAKKVAARKIELDNYDRYMRRFDDPSCLNKMDILNTVVAGTRYPNDDTGENRQDILKKTKVGELLKLLPDELNRYDNSAIKVVKLNDKQIGFLDMDLSIEIKSRLMSRSPVEASITKIYDKGGNLECEIALQRYSRKIKKQ
ncbi:HIRAN domain-containing protein [Flammeovirga yaeyamensis]|uniref:HIRAN domain-containing protein n=1 Tax=Flammeovirga yaeyamensis TaxID=367791 RepID=A0AAX1MY39_9BACT|nr:MULTISPECIES: HIRAN domain-containing protein [Flammeovirga]ANQ48381.1 hypothetical protein MY04_0999 [Flammeovirga sp. MY04]MBB3696283.1 hypothetical protein [Flammeovirga yaeyamensis]NMF34964.1 hypothetical protein [Flammeovirga yaeyamensis]QWG00211.1 HIRAN domain-containing protein [Flammeovirga yaeyamensis]